MFSNYIISELQSDIRTFVLIPEGFPDPKGILLLDQTLQIPEDYLCVGSVSDFLTLLSGGDSPSGTFFLSDTATERKLPEHLPCNLVVTGLSVTALHNRLTLALAEYQNQKNHQTELPGSDYDAFFRLVNSFPRKREKYMRAILVQTDDPKAAEDTRIQNNLFQELAPLFPMDNITRLDRYIFILISSRQAHCPLLADKTRMEQILEKYQATAVINHTTFSIKALHINCIKSQIILPIIMKVRLEPNTRLTYFGRYNLYLTIDICARNLKHSLGSEDIIYLCSPGILTLTRYDQAYNNNLRDVLFHYLLNDRSIAETSKALFLHRNTTIYKINKIEELIHHSLDDPYYRFHLLFSCMLIRYYEEYQGHKLTLSPFIRDDYKP